ncbi:hypothetical protein M413DRAFT_29301 [Hebeloma cylindrosporum]|uniref:Uncharacterized protein n=1 Tax=Hebeloma cylindrosporum TaxID=76867 RepID=A0A0C2YF21_HEBCY|nr:hypothetical protein M413DRAFT_29301 [Hebeloma cylindrosporum h7]
MPFSRFYSSLATPLDKTRFKDPRGRDQPESTSREMISIIKRLSYSGLRKGWADHRVSGSRLVENHKRHFISRMLRRRFLPNKNLSPPPIFTWSHPDFCCSDTSDASPCHCCTPDLSPKHDGEAPEPFVWARAKTFEPLPAIEEEGDDASSSQICQPVPILISRDILPIDEGEKEAEEGESKAPERVDDFNLPPGKDKSLALFKIFPAHGNLE